MLSDRKLLERFEQAILDKDISDIQSEIAAHKRISVTAQAAIYINGYRLRLLRVLQADYPALLHLLGEKEFERLAIAYIEANPSLDFNIDRYPHKFADFISTNDKFAKDLAMLESTISQVFMLPDSNALTGEFLNNLTPESFAEAVLLPRIAARLCKFDYNVDDYLSKQRLGSKPPHTTPLPEGEGTYLYIYRHKNEVQRIELPQAGYYLLEQLFAGKNIATAVGDLLEQNPEYSEAIAENLQTWLIEWINNGFFRSL